MAAFHVSQVSDRTTTTNGRREVTGTVTVMVNGTKWSEYSIKIYRTKELHLRWCTWSSRRPPRRSYECGWEIQSRPTVVPVPLWVLSWTSVVQAIVYKDHLCHPYCSCPSSSALCRHPSIRSRIPFFQRKILFSKPILPYIKLNESLRLLAYT